MENEIERQSERAAYIPPDIESMTFEWSRGETIGEKSHIDALNDVYNWMRGHQRGFYGWANDGKGTFWDFQAVMKAKFSNWKFMMMKQEDMSSTKQGKKIKVTANDIYKNLVWTYTGKTPYKHFAAKYHQQQIPLDEYMAALEWVQEHFYIMFPKDRRYKSVKDDFKFYFEKFGIDGFLIDPFKSIILPEGQRGDQILNEIFIETKEFAQETNTVFDWIAHPKSMSDVKDGKKEDSPYKVVNQFMISGGAAWDNNMDSQYSIYRPERHIDSADPKVHFYNLKQRQAEVVGVQRGVYKDIKFDYLKKRYFFNGTCPLDGSQKPDKFASTAQPFINWSEARDREEAAAPVEDPDALPF